MVVSTATVSRQVAVQRGVARGVTGCAVVGAGDTFWHSFREVADDARPVGNLVPDAFVAALMLEHGVSTIVTRDRDFRRFGHVRIEDPFAGS